jgi:zinc transporter ZupT
LEINLITILFASGLTALVTGLGALPFLFIKNINRWWLSIFHAGAAGLMLGASHNLVREGATLNPYRVLIGILLGWV